MTRGTLFYYEGDNAVWSSTEYNGDMYHGTRNEPEGIGDDVIELMSNLKSLKDFEDVLVEINKNYEYDEGNKAYSIAEEAIDNFIKDTIEWIDKERLDLKNTDDDPRTWEKKPSFRDVTTWRFWGIPNLSDYSYIYNNSGTELVLNTNNSIITIPHGWLGVLNYGRNDCLCLDGEIIDGMGTYKDMPEYAYEVSVKGLTTYKVYADNEEKAKLKAIDCFFDDDEFYGLEITENVTEDECEIINVEEY